MQKTHFFQDIEAEGPQVGPQIFFLKRNYYDTSFLIHVWGPIWGPSILWPKKIHFFSTFLVEQVICSNQDSDEWGPTWGPKILEFVSMISQLSLEKKIKCLSILDQILDFLQRV